MQETWNTMKKPNLRIERIEKGKKYREKSMENIFSKL